MPNRGMFDIVLDETEVQLIPAPYISHVINLGLDWKNRIIHLSGEIEEDSGEWMHTVIESLGKDRIEIHLNTPGGDVDSMYAIHDTIRRHGNIKVYGYGQVCSAGVLILACGHEREVAESTILMSHESTGSAGELGYRAAKDRRKADDWQHVYWAELMARYTPNDARWWRQKTEKTAEYWLLGGREIVEAGLADKVA
jgi:ATP-dependent protease ClpP protease subunit